MSNPSFSGMMLRIASDCRIIVAAIRADTRCLLLVCVSLRRYVTAADNHFPRDRRCERLSGSVLQCQNCRQAWLQGGPSLRKRSSALINSDLLIDLGPDIMTASHMHIALC